MKTEQIFLYEGRQDVSLTTYLWEDGVDFEPGVQRPAILICPGGGYLNCAVQEGAPIALRFAAMGYHAFVLRYSTYCMGKKEFIGPGRKLEPKPETAHPTPVREIGKAMLLIRKHADAWHVDVDRIAVCGFSAGGHNAALYATSYHRDVVADYLGVDKALLRPAAAILGYPVIDYGFMQEKVCGSAGFRGEFFKNSNIAFLGTDTPSEELLREVSPNHLVDENTPPMFLWTTAADELVPTMNTLLMGQALSEHHIPFTMHIFENGKHGLALGTQASAQSQRDLSPEVDGWMDMADKWLQKRFALPLPEMTAFERMTAQVNAKKQR